MKNHILICLAFLLLFCGCAKENNQLPNKVAPITKNTIVQSNGDTIYSYRGVMSPGGALYPNYDTSITGQVIFSRNGYISFNHLQYSDLGSDTVRYVFHDTLGVYKFSSCNNPVVIPSLSATTLSIVKDSINYFSDQLSSCGEIDNYYTFIGVISR